MGMTIALVCQRNNNVPFIFESAAAAGHRLVLIHAPGETPPTHLPATGPTLELDVFADGSGALDRLEAERPKFDAIVTSRDEAMLWTALAAQRLGLPGLAPEVAIVTRDKAKMRACFVEAGLNVPRYVKLERDQPVELPREMAFPVVVKPTGGCSSQGVIRVDAEVGLAPAVARVRAINDSALEIYNRDPGKFEADAPGWGAVIVEEYLDGPEYVLEAIASKGRVHILSIGYKGNPQGPYFEETVYLSPPPLPVETVAAMAEQVAGGMAALGLTDSPGHCELRLRNGKVPYLLEIGARVGGSGVSHFIVQESSGVDFAGLQFRQASGLALPDLPLLPKTVAAAGNWIIPTGGHGRLVEIKGLEEVARHPDTRRILTFLAPGTLVEPYPIFSGYPGFILSRHANWQAGAAYHNWLAETVRVRWTEN